VSERDNDYSGVADLPPLVAKAADLARSYKFKNSCAVPYGRLLRVLVGQCAVVGEMGAGCGVGTAWMLDGMRPDARIVTIERDAFQVSGVRSLFTDEPRVTVLHGDALEIAAHGPFDFVYADAPPGKHERQQEAVELLRPGGMILLDDLTPGETNGVRTWWMDSPDVHAIEITLTPELAAILAVRR